MAKGILRIYMCLGRYQGHVLPLQSNDESPPLLQFEEGSSCKVCDGSLVWRSYCGQKIGPRPETYWSRRLTFCSWENV